MHPLLRFARRTPIDAPSSRPTDADYDFPAGLWRSADGLLIDDPDRLPRTKKFDIETGEDAKGQ